VVNAILSVPSLPFSALNIAVFAAEIDCPVRPDGRVDKSRAAAEVGPVGQEAPITVGMSDPLSCSAYMILS